MYCDSDTKSKKKKHTTHFFGKKIPKWRSTIMRMTMRAGSSLQLAPSSLVFLLKSFEFYHVSVFFSTCKLSTPLKSSQFTPLAADDSNRPSAVTSHWRDSRRRRWAVNRALNAAPGDTGATQTRRRVGSAGSSTQEWRVSVQRRPRGSPADGAHSSLEHANRLK